MARVTNAAARATRDGVARTRLSRGGGTPVTATPAQVWWGRRPRLRSGGSEGADAVRCAEPGRPVPSGHRIAPLGRGAAAVAAAHHVVQARSRLVRKAVGVHGRSAAGRHAA